MNVFMGLKSSFKLPVCLRALTDTKMEKLIIAKHILSSNIWTVLREEVKTNVREYVF